MTGFTSGKVMVCALGLLTLGIARTVRADVEWTTTDGAAVLTLGLNTASTSAKSARPAGADESTFDFEVGAGAPLAYYNLFLNEFIYAQLPLNGAFRIPGTNLAMDGLSLRIRQNSLTEDIKADITDASGKRRLFELGDAYSDFDQATNTMTLHAGAVVVSKALAEQIGRPSLEGANVGTLNLATRVEWSGGDDASMNAAHEYLATLPAAGGAPRIGNTPDVIYADCSNVSTYGPVGSMYAYALASTTCNIGGATLLWGTSNNGTPALAMNAYRIFDGRLEQIGQGWVKHSCCAAAGSLCGTCTGGGGQQLGAGCSDVYGSGYNGGQSRLGPRSQINAFTGNITPAPSDSGSQIYKRLQVEQADMMLSNYPGAQFLIEGVYVGSDDAASGNGYNNASYRMASISQSNFDMSMLDSMQVGVPAIYAWHDHGNGLNAPDNSVHVQEVDVPGEGIFHLASKVTDNGNGTWRFDYAVYNLNSDRAGASFSVPIGAATVTNVGFHDVQYHSGEPYDNTDWIVTNDGTTITWSSPQTFAENANSNALRWGTMYNFWFTSDVGPDDEPADVTLGLFKPGTPTSVTATADVPLAGAVIVRLPDGAPSILPTCQSTTIPVEIKDGSETYLPQSAKLYYRYDGGTFQEAALASVGGDLYEATLPTPICGDTPEYYLLAQSAEGTTVTNPKDALTLQQYYAAQPGFADTLVYLETDFENGLPAGWSQNGLWNVSATCSSVPLGNCQGSDGSNVAYFGQTSTCNYDTGAIVNDSMFTPPIALPDVDQISLTYCSALERDTTPIGDWPEVRVTPDGGATVVVDQPAVGAFVGGPPIWEERTVDLSEFAGQTVTIAFNFNNVFPSNDDQLGWQLDNVLVSAPGVTCIPGCEGPDGDANGDSLTDGRDMASIVSAVMSQSTDPQMLAALDFNNDGVVNTADIGDIVNALLNQ